MTEYEIAEFARRGEAEARFVAVVRAESPRTTTIEVWPITYEGRTTESWRAGQGSPDGFPVGGPDPAFPPR